MRTIPVLCASQTTCQEVRKQGLKVAKHVTQQVRLSEGHAMSVDLQVPQAPGRVGQVVQSMALSYSLHCLDLTLLGTAGRQDTIHYKVMFSRMGPVDFTGMMQQKYTLKMTVSSLLHQYISNRLCIYTVISIPVPPENLMESKTRRVCFCQQIMVSFFLPP